MSMPNQPLRRPIITDSALMNPNSRILALKALIQGTNQDHLQIFNIEAKAKIKSHQMPEQVAFWKWITPKMCLIDFGMPVDKDTDELPNGLGLTRKIHSNVGLKRKLEHKEQRTLKRLLLPFFWLN